LGAQDGEPGLERWALDIDGEAPLQARAERLDDTTELRRNAIYRYDDLLARVMHVVEGVEELFLEFLLALEELDVIDEQNVGAAIASAEGIEAAAEGAHVVVAEALGGGVDDGEAALVGRMADGVQQVGL